MARARSPNSIEAEEMYKNGMKLVDIAKKLDVPASTVQAVEINTELGRKDKRKEKRTFAKEKSERSP